MIDPAPAAYPRAVRHLCLALLLACAGLAGSVHGQTLAGPGSVAWAKLSPAQRGVLTPLERDWNSISPGQQQKWAELANRFPALPADERSRVQQRIAEWSRLTPQQRASARLNFQEARQLSPEERQHQWDAYRALPTDQRRALAERADRPRTAVPAAPRSGDTGVKSSVVKAPAPAQAHPVGPTVVQRGSGATTSLVSKPATPPLHQQTGLPKVTATPGFVDSATLLPKRGAQGAAAAQSTVGDNEKIKAQ